uniref:DUF834 domain-containing protein n=1 Tax=Oryza barthii TaxID=65489 RepID=A0A0D3HJC6_9ORYZ
MPPAWMTEVEVVRRRRGGGRRQPECRRPVLGREKVDQAERPERRCKVLGEEDQAEVDPIGGGGSRAMEDWECGRKRISSTAVAEED